MVVRGRRWLAQVLVALLAMSGLVLATSDQAEACSCATRSFDELVEQTELGVVGTVVSVERYSSEYEFEVEAWVHGAGPDGTITVWGAPYPSSSCGFESPPGAFVAVFVDQIDGRFVASGACPTVPGEVAMAIAFPPTPVSGLAELAVVGDFDQGRVAYFARDGAFLGYRGGDEELWDPTHLARCRDSDVLLLSRRSEVRRVHLGRGETDGFPWGEAATAGSSIGVAGIPSLADLSCVGRSPVILVDPGASLLDAQRWVRPARHDSELAVPAAGRQASLVGDTVIAWSSDRLWTDGERGLTSSGLEHPIRSVADAADGRRIAYLEESFDDAVVHVVDVDLGARPQLSVELEGSGYGLGWIDDNRIAVLGYDGEGGSWVHVVGTRSGEVLGTFRPGMNVRGAVWFDDALWHVFRGTLYRAEFGDTPQRMAGLPLDVSGRLFVLEEPFVIEHAASVTPTTASATSTPSSTVPPTTEPAVAGAALPAVDAADDGAAPVGWMLAATAAALALTGLLLNWRGRRSPAS